MIHRIETLCLAILMTAASLPASAGIVSELRGGLLDHASTLVSSGREDGVDLNLEVIFNSVPYTLGGHPHLGTSFNNDSNNTDHVYAGLTWDGRPVGEFQIRFALGAAYHNGEKLRFSDEVRGLGNTVLFHFGLDLGWRFSPRWDVSVYAQHMSNGPFDGERGVNDGLDNIGLRLGYHFNPE